MQLITEKKAIIVASDSPSYYTDLVVDAGDPRQYFDQAIDEYVPDRRYVPCEVRVYAKDYSKRLTQLADVRWFEGEPKTDGSNLIKTLSGVYTVAGERLVVYKNFSPNRPADIYCLYKIVDPFSNISSSDISKHITFSCSSFLINRFHIEYVSGGPNMTINPLNETSYTHELSVELKNGDSPVNYAYYDWEVLDHSTNQWRPIDTRDKFVTSVIDQNYLLNNKITIDSRKIEEENIRCVAWNPTTEGMDKPSNILYLKNFNVKVSLPKSIQATYVQTAGGKFKRDFSDGGHVKAKCVIFTNQGNIPEDKYNLFDIKWYSESALTHSVDEIGTGRELDYVPTIGISTSNGMIYAKVELKKN